MTEQQYPDFICALRDVIASGTPVNLQGFRRMPLDIVKLSGSGILVESTGDEFKAALRLWTFAWHQIPAGTLPDIEAQLAKGAGYEGNPKAWKKIRAAAMRGWVLLPNGRYFHETLAEIVLDTLKIQRSRSTGGKNKNEKDKNAQAAGNKVNASNSSTPAAPAHAGGVAHAQADAEAGAQEQVRSRVEKNRVDKSPPTPSQPDATADAADVGKIADDIWAMAGLTHIGDRKHTSGNVDDYRHVRTWISAGYTPAEIRAAAQAIITRTGEITSLWGLLAKALPDEVLRIRNPSEAASGSRSTGGEGMHPDAGRSQAVARYVGFIEQGFWHTSFGDRDAVPQDVKDEAQRIVDAKKSKVTA